MSNDFKVFAGSSGADVVTQVEYESLAALLTGFTTGTAVSGQLNKVWRQSSIMAAMIGQFIDDHSSGSAVDDGTLTNLKTLFIEAIKSTGGVLAENAGGTADALTAVFASPPASVSHGSTFFIRASTQNLTTTPTFTPSPGVTVPATIVKGNNLPLAVGDIQGAGHWLILTWDNLLGKWGLENPAPLSLAAAVAGTLGYNQTWSNPARVNGTNYQNTTGKPIMVVTWSGTSGACNISVSVDNVTYIVVAADSSGGAGGVSSGCGGVIIPPGHWWRYAGGVIFAELA